MSSKPELGGGVLRVLDAPQGEGVIHCPLKHTEVRASISAFLARVTLTQVFANDSGRTIEAIYLFPLPHLAAVDRMEMRIGERVIRGVIRTKEEARATYDEARRQGYSAALLEQQRPNVFRQSVANIGPGEEVRVTISYVETLRRERGAYQWDFPMVVGPRYTRGGEMEGAVGVEAGYVPAGVRPGHDISVEVEIDGGVAVRRVSSVTHEIDLQLEGTRARVSLARLKEIPNRDFSLRYELAGDAIQPVLLTHYDQRGGFFLLFVEPPAGPPVKPAAPREIVFVVDRSGSMSGAPIRSARLVMQGLLRTLAEDESFNIVAFASRPEKLFPAPRPATADNLERAWAYLQSCEANGGTEMLAALAAGLEGADISRLRVLVFLTDGEIGDDREMLAEVRRNPEVRVFSFAIGSSPNRFLLERMAVEGRGSAEIVLDDSLAAAAVARFNERLRSPVLVDVQADWGDLRVEELAPARLPDLFSATPLALLGRYRQPASATLTLRGIGGEGRRSFPTPVELPGEATGHDVIATLWARARVEDWAAEKLGATESRAREAREAITRLGLDFGLMTDYTSFVAVEEKRRSETGELVTVEVPLALPEEMQDTAKFMCVAPLPAMAIGVDFSSCEPPAPEDDPLFDDGLATLLAKWIVAPGVTPAQVQDGKAPVVLRFSEFSGESREALDQARFEQIRTARGGRWIYGWIPLDQLCMLVRVPGLKKALLWRRPTAPGSARA